MKIKENPRAFIFAAVFLVMIAGIGTASLGKLINYYKGGEADYNEWSPELGNKLETDMATSFYQKFNFVNLNGVVRNILGQREMNGVVKLNNGYLLTTCPKVSDEYLQYDSERVYALKKYLDETGIKFLYVITPYTSGKYDPQLPIGIEDWGNDNLDRLSEMLEAKEIETLDLRETMHDDGIDHYDMMYRTDHHWTTRGGFYAYLKINEKLEKLLDCQVDPQVKDFSNYTVKTYESWHLGLRGQRTGVYYAGSDDFDLILPDFETAITCVGGVTDTYENLIVNMSALDNKNSMSRYTYDTTLENTELDYINEYAFNDKKILVLSDSFGKAVNGFLIMSYAECRCAGVGVGRELTYHYLEEYEPDAVIMLYYVNNAVSPGFYSFELPDE